MSRLSSHAYEKQMMDTSFLQLLYCGNKAGAICESFPSSEAARFRQLLWANAPVS